jgi:hypothetical protein
MAVSPRELSMDAAREISDDTIDYISQLKKKYRDTIYEENDVHDQLEHLHMLVIDMQHKFEQFASLSEEQFSQISSELGSTMMSSKGLADEIPVKRASCVVASKSMLQQQRQTVDYPKRKETLASTFRLELTPRRTDRKPWKSGLSPLQRKEHSSPSSKEGFEAERILSGSLRLTLGTLCHLTDCEWGVVFALDASTKQLVSMASCGLKSEKTLCVSPSTGVLGSVMRSGMAANLCHASAKKAFFGETEGFTSSMMRSVMIAPLFFKERPKPSSHFRLSSVNPVGVVQLVNKAGGVPFSQEDESLITNTASIFADTLFRFPLDLQKGTSMFHMRQFKKGLCSRMGSQLQTSSASCASCASCASSRASSFTSFPIRVDRTIPSSQMIFRKIDKHDTFDEKELIEARKSGVLLETSAFGKIEISTPRDVMSYIERFDESWKKNLRELVDAREKTEECEKKLERHIGSESALSEMVYRMEEQKRNLELKVLDAEDTIRDLREKLEEAQSLSSRSFFLSPRSTKPKKKVHVVAPKATKLRSKARVHIDPTSIKVSTEAKDDHRASAHVHHPPLKSFQSVPYLHGGVLSSEEEDATHAPMDEHDSVIEEDIINYLSGVTDSGGSEDDDGSSWDAEERVEEEMSMRALVEDGLPSIGTMLP